MPEECLDISELSGNDRATFCIVRRDLKRRVYKKATLALPVVDRVVDNLCKETSDRLFRRKLFLEPAQPFPRRLLKVLLKRPSE